MPNPTYTFVSGQKIESTKVNANFLLLSQCVAKSGDTLTGTLNVRSLIPTTTDAYALGSSSLTFSSAFLGNLKLSDTDASHFTTIVGGSNLTANRTLTITTGDSDRTVTLSGNPTLGDWFDQAVKTTSTPTFAGVTANVTGNVSGTAASVTGATQNSITSIPNLATVGTITSGTWSGSFGAVSGANLTTLNASNISSGTLGTGRLSGSYTGITGVGALAAGSITSGFTAINGGSFVTTLFGAVTSGYSVDTNYTVTKDTVVTFFSDGSSQLTGRVDGVDIAVSNFGNSTGVLFVPKNSTWRVALGGGSYASIHSVTVGV